MPTYLWDIVYAYFDNLKEHGSYDPLHILERKPTTIRDKEGSNWLAARMVQLRRSYLAYLGKPQNIAEAIRQYNSTRHRDNKKIVNSEDLIHRLKEVFETDLTQWREPRAPMVNLQDRYVDGCARTIPVLREHAAVHARLRRVSRHFPGHR